MRKYQKKLVKIIKRREKVTVGYTTKFRWFNPKTDAWMLLGGICPKLLPQEVKEKK